jgi:hypothetical protein
MIAVPFDLRQTWSDVSRKPDVDQSPAARLRTLGAASALIIMVGAMPATRDAILKIPVREAAGRIFTLKYDRVASMSRPAHFIMNVWSEKGDEVTLTLTEPFATAYRLVRVQPQPFSTTNTGNSVRLTFKSQQKSDLAVSMDVVPVSLGWTSQSISVAVGRAINATMTVEQFVTP